MQKFKWIFDHLGNKGPFVLYREQLSICQTSREFFCEISCVSVYFGCLATWRFFLLLNGQTVSKLNLEVNAQCEIKKRLFSVQFTFTGRGKITDNDSLVSIHRLCIFIAL